MAGYLYDIQEIQTLRSIAIQNKLSMPNSFLTADDIFLCACYNGIGPDRWSGYFRRITTWLLDFFAADALIHDYEYSLPAKSYFHFTMANLRFVWNAAVLAFSSYDKKKAIQITGLGLLLGLLCQFFGYDGYKNGTITIKEKNK